jgi:hypothetical protein
MRMMSGLAARPIVPGSSIRMEEDDAPMARRL